MTRENWKKYVNKWVNKEVSKYVNKCQLGSILVGTCLAQNDYEVFMDDGERTLHTLFGGFFGSLASPKYDYWGDKTHPLGNFGLFSLPASFFRGNYPRTAKKKLFEGKWSLLPSFPFLTLDCITKETGRETLISRISQEFLEIDLKLKASLNLISFRVSTFAHVLN